MVDALCEYDLDPYGTELDDPLAELYQDILHRLIEPPGSNLDDPTRGFGLQNRLSMGGRSGGLSLVVKHGIEAELLKDTRLSAVRATVTQTAVDAYSIAIQFVANEVALGITLESTGNGIRRVA